MKPDRLEPVDLGPGALAASLRDLDGPRGVGGTAEDVAVAPAEQQEVLDEVAAQRLGDGDVAAAAGALEVDLALLAIPAPADVDDIGVQVDVVDASAISSPRRRPA